MNVTLQGKLFTNPVDWQDVLDGNIFGATYVPESGETWYFKNYTGYTDRIVYKIGDGTSTLLELHAYIPLIDAEAPITEFSEGVGIKLNYSAFDTPSGGRCYIHGFTLDGIPADVNGFIYHNSDYYVVNKSTLYPNKELKGFIALNKLDNRCVSVEYSYSTNTFIVRQYNDPLDGVAITESEWLYIGKIETSSASVVTRAYINSKALTFADVKTDLLGDLFFNTPDSSAFNDLVTNSGTEIYNFVAVHEAFIERLVARYIQLIDGNFKAYLNKTDGFKIMQDTVPLLHAPPTGGLSVTGTVTATAGSFGGVSIASGKVYVGAGNFNNADTAFYLGNDGKLSLKDKLSWDGTTLTLSGTINADAGLIGGFTIHGTDGIYAGTGATRIQLKVGAGVWLGATAIGDAPFSVTPAGLLKTISALIGGWTVDSNGIKAGSTNATAKGMLSGDTIAFYAGHLTPASAPFRVTQAGALVATSATITGAITATSGTIGGWTVHSTDGLYTGSGVTRIQLKTSEGIWLGATAFADAPFSVTPAGVLKAVTGYIGGATNGWEITAGFITALGTGKIRTGTTTTRLELDSTGLKGYNSGTQRFQVLNDGSGWLGGSTLISWTNAGVLTVGGWTINATTIVGGNATLDSTGFLNLGTSNDIVKLSAVDATYRLWVGHATASSAPFRVTKAGVLTATGVTVTGTINATAGYFGTIDNGWTISSTEIVATGTGKIRTSSSTTRLELDSTGIKGYNAGTQRFQILGDGSGWFGASNKIAWTTAGVLTISGWTVSGTAITATNISLTPGAANTAHILVGTGSTAGGLNSANASGDIAIWAGATHANRATAAFRVTAGGVLVATNATITGSITATSGTIGNWIVGTLLSSAASGARIELNPTKSRISIFDSTAEKVVMGYLEGLPKNDGSGSWGAGDYGFWAKSGDMLRIDGDAEYINGDWLIQNDASYLIKSGATVLVRLGTYNAEKGLFINEGATGSNYRAKYTASELFVGNDINSIKYNAMGLVISGRVAGTYGQIGSFNSPLLEEFNITFDAGVHTYKDVYDWWIANVTDQEGVVYALSAKAGNGTEFFQGVLRPVTVAALRLYYWSETLGKQYTFFNYNNTNFLTTSITIYQLYDQAYISNNLVPQENLLSNLGGIGNLWKNVYSEKLTLVRDGDLPEIFFRNNYGAPLEPNYYINVYGSTLRFLYDNDNESIPKTTFLEFRPTGIYAPSFDSTIAEPTKYLGVWGAGSATAFLSVATKAIQFTNLGKIEKVSNDKIAITNLKLTLASSYPNNQGVLNIPNIGTSDPSASVAGDIWHRSNVLLYKDGAGTIRQIAHTGSWSAMSQAELEAGTATTSRFMRADYAKAGIQTIAKGVCLPLTGGSLTGLLSVAQNMSSYVTAFTAPHLALKASNVVDNTGFVGITFDTSTSANYGWSIGALRSTAGQGDFVFKFHSSSAEGVERFRIKSDGTIKVGIFTSAGFVKTNASGELSVDTNTYLTGNQTITLSGDVSGSGATSIAVTVNQIKSKAIPTLATGYLRYTGSAWEFKNETYLTGNQTITLSGDVSGSGATSIAVTVNQIKSKEIPTLATGYLRYTGSVWEFKNETYSLSTHNHDSDYLKLSGGTLTGNLTARNILPPTNSDYDLGSADYRWKSIYAASSIDVGGTLKVGTVVGIGVTPDVSYDLKTANDVLIGKNLKVTNYLGVGTDPSSSYDIKTGANSLIGGTLYLTSTNTALSQGSNNSLRVTTNSGYVEIAPQNTGYCHFMTNIGQFYFNSKIVSAGNVEPYSDGSPDLGSSSKQWRSLFLDSNAVMAYLRCKTAYSSAPSVSAYSFVVRSGADSPRWYHGSWRYFNTTSGGWA